VAKDVTGREDVREDDPSGSATVLALTGGIGGAKLALGLQRVLDPGQLIVVCNTGDDFRHLGLQISPDVDTVLYTLAGLSDSEKGWGRSGETWNFMAALEELGGQTWFRLGDRDLALHVERTWRLNDGELLSTVTDRFRNRLGLATRVLPMSDDSVTTQLLTREGEWLDFQEYFVHRKCEPAIERIRFVGAAGAKAAPGVLAALEDPGLTAVVVCPSNPLISIDPILAVPGIREALRRCAAPVVAVSPLIGGQAVKGPTAKLMHELRLEPTAACVAERYADFIDAWVVDAIDAAVPVPRGVRRVVTKTLMVTLEDRERLARDALEAAQHVSREQPRNHTHPGAVSWTFWM
jgi:LPPG:FO 2-phospho-L-lactate transferase